MSVSDFSHVVLQGNQEKKWALDVVGTYHDPQKWVLVNFELFWSPEAASGTPTLGLYLSISASDFSHVVLQVIQEK